MSLGLIWMIANSTPGIMYDYAFVHERVSVGNILFYTWFVLSFAAFLWWVIRVWRKPIVFEE